jgi:hypothetical protein
MRLPWIAVPMMAALFSLGGQHLAASPTTAALHAGMPAVLLADVDVPKLDVDVDVDKDRAWYKNPLVIGLGVVVVVLIAALAGRGSGGGTSIIDRRH